MIHWNSWRSNRCVLRCFTSCTPYQLSEPRVHVGLSCPWAARASQERNTPLENGTMRHDVIDSLVSHAAYFLSIVITRPSRAATFLTELKRGFRTHHKKINRSPIEEQSRGFSFLEFSKFSNCKEHQFYTNFFLESSLRLVRNFSVSYAENFVDI